MEQYAAQADLDDADEDELIGVTVNDTSYIPRSLLKRIGYKLVQDEESGEWEAVQREGADQVCCLLGVRGECAGVRYGWAVGRRTRRQQNDSICEPHTHTYTHQHQQQQESCLLLPRSLALLAASHPLCRVELHLRTQPAQRRPVLAAHHHTTPHDATRRRRLSSPRSSRLSCRPSLPAPPSTRATWTPSCAT